MNEGSAASDATDATLPGYTVRPSTAGRAARSAVTDRPDLAAASLGAALAGSAGVTSLIASTNSACARLPSNVICL